MQSAVAAERAKADGWLPRIINPGEGMDFAFGYNRLTLQIGDDGTVAKAFRG